MWSALIMRRSIVLKLNESLEQVSDLTRFGLLTDQAISEFQFVQGFTICAGGLIRYNSGQSHLIGEFSPKLNKQAQSGKLLDSPFNRQVGPVFWRNAGEQKLCVNIVFFYYLLLPWEKHICSTEHQVTVALDYIQYFSMM